MRNNCISEYYRILKAIFPLKSYYEAKFLKDFKNSLIEFYNNNPNCTFDDLTIEFGTPQEVLLEYMDTQDFLVTAKAIKKQTTKKYLFFTCVIILFLSMFIYILFLYNLKEKVENAIPDNINTVIEEEVTQ